MRIAYVLTRADDIGGAQIHVRDLSEALQAKGHEITVLAGGGGRFSAELAARDIPFIGIPHLAGPINFGKDGLALLEILHALRRTKPDLVSTHTAKAGFLGRIASAILGIPAVSTPHGWAITDRISAAQGRVFRCAEAIAGLFSSRIVNVCEFEKRLAVDCGIAPLRKLAVIHNGIPDVGKDLLAEPERDPPVLTMVARFAEPKQHLALLDALAGLKHLVWSMEFIGDGPLEHEVRVRAAELGIAERVRFCGFSCDPAVKLAQAQILVLASRFEAFPYSILEGMRAGLPIVASDVGGIREAVTDGVTGLLSAPGNVDGMRGCLAACISDASFRKRLGANGRGRYLQLFTMEKMVAETLSVYRNILSPARNAERIPSKAI